MDFTQFTPATAIVTTILLVLAPFAAVMVTSFTKIVVVLGLLRNALGLQQSPPNIVLNGLALILSIYVMYPTVQKMSAAIATSQVSLSPQSGSDMLAIANAAKEPLRDFLIRHTPPRERAFFFKTARKILPDPAKAELGNNDFVVIIPAFTVSELSKAFQIGFLMFLPFLIIDLVISNILMAMGMMMLSPTTVSLPFKLLLFVLIDGWVKLAHGLVLSYAGG